MRLILACVVVASSVSAFAGVAHAERIVAIAPLSTLGTEDTSASTKRTVTQIEQAIGALPGTKVVSAAQVADAIKKAKKPQLKACEGDAGCLAEVGKLVGAQIVIAGEVGGLGESKVIYLGATDVATAKELRSTTLAMGSSAASDKDDNGGAVGAAVRLLDPDRYVGTVHFTLDVTGATVFVNGTVVKLDRASNLPVHVGTQALRITHPQYRDFVRFVDVGYGKTTEVTVGLHQYPTVEHDIQGNPINRDKVEYVDPPMWRRWYVAGPAVVALAIVAGVIGYDLSHRFPDGQCRDPHGC